MLVERVAGGGTKDPAETGEALEALIQRPTGLAMDGDGTFFVVDGNAGTLLAVDSTGRIHVLASGMTGPVGDGLVGMGPVYIAERGANRVLLKALSKPLKVVAGDELHVGFRGDGGLARNAWLSNPTDVAVDEAGNVYIADATNYRIRVITGGKVRKISTVAGNGTPGFSGDGGPATQAQLSNPQLVVVNPAGTQLLIGDYSNGRIRRVDLATGVITTIAGNGGGAVTYDPALTATQTPITRISALALDPLGRVYTTIFYGNTGTLVMRINLDGTLTRILGGGTNPAEGIPPDQFASGDILAMDFDPLTGDLLFGQSDGRVLRLAGVAQSP